MGTVPMRWIFDDQANDVYLRGADVVEFLRVSGHDDAARRIETFADSVTIDCTHFDRGEPV